MKVAPEILLTEEERTTLERWSRGRSTPARLVLRSKIVLLAAEGRMNQKIAPRLKTGMKTVSLWRRRFAEERLAGIEKDFAATNWVMGDESKNEAARFQSQDRRVNTC